MSSKECSPRYVFDKYLNLINSLDSLVHIDVLFVMFVIQALKFGRVVGVPGESDFVIHGAASLRTGAVTPTGEKISIGCLVKLEMNVQSNAIRVTTRTLHPAASLAVMATAKTLLA